MPPIADKRLEERILKAAQRLLQRQGTEALTLRAVAKLAGTTTPTLYQRFRSKEALLVAVALRVREELNARTFAAISLEGACRAYLQYAEENPHGYDLMRVVWPEVIAGTRPRPGRAWLLARMAERFGGEAEDYAPAFYAFLFLLHGTATLLTSTTDAAAAKEMRQNCIAVCETLIRHAHILRKD